MRYRAAKRLPASAACPFRASARNCPATRGRHKQSQSVSCTALQVKATYPIPETEKEPSTINPPEEWTRPRPSERPDIFPDLEKLETPLPHKLPGDPELPEDEEWEEKEKKKPDNDPDKKPTETPDKDKKKKKKKEDEKEGEEDDSDKEGDDEDIPETE